jgi:hypothetical protein
MRCATPRPPRPPPSFGQPRADILTQLRIYSVFAESRWRPRTARSRGASVLNSCRARLSSSSFSTPREIAEQLQRAEDQKAAAFGRNDFAALPAMQEEVERLAALLQAAEGAGRADAAARSELERSQAERLAELRRDAEQAVSGAQAAVRDKL